MWDKKELLKTKPKTYDECVRLLTKLNYALQDKVITQKEIDKKLKELGFRWAL